MILLTLPDYQPTFQEAMSYIAKDSLPLYEFSDLERHNYLNVVGCEVVPATCKPMFITATPHFAEDSAP